MNTNKTQLIDRRGRLIGVAHIVDEGTHYGGTIDLSATPSEVRALFELFEEMVNGQEFTCADDVQTKIDALGIRAVSQDGSDASVSDVQVFPETGDVSFRIGCAAGVNGTGAAPKNAVSDQSDGGRG